VGVAKIVIVVMVVVVVLQLLTFVDITELWKGVTEQRKKDVEEVVGHQRQHELVEDGAESVAQQGDNGVSVDGQTDGAEGSGANAFQRKRDRERHRRRPILKLSG